MDMKNFLQQSICEAINSASKVIQWLLGKVFQDPFKNNPSFPSIWECAVKTHT